MSTEKESAVSIDPNVVERSLSRARLAQAVWKETPIRNRLRVIRRLRRLIAEQAEDLVAAVGDLYGREPADTYATEVIPLVDACRFLEREAVRLLRTRRLGRRGRPLWLMGAEAEIRREALGVVLILAPSNYPLFLPGVQLVQALVAGNAVLLKPAPGCTAPVAKLNALLVTAGLPGELVQLLDEDIKSARAAIARSVDHVVLTGSAETGRAVLDDLAPRLTPATLELSGNDAVFVLKDADLPMVADALAFGLRLNGGATCIAPRRVFVPKDQSVELEQLLQQRLVNLPRVPVAASMLKRLGPLFDEARDAGCRFVISPPPAGAQTMEPVVVADAIPAMGLLKADIFAPVLALVPVCDPEEALRFDDACPYALGASVFGPERPAQQMAECIQAGIVTINDLIAPTADPRLPFGGRGESGYGVTRGAEGLLDLTRVKVVITRHGRFRPHYEPGTKLDQTVFCRYLSAVHGSGWIGRVRSSYLLLVALIRRAQAARSIGGQR